MAPKRKAAAAPKSVKKPAKKTAKAAAKPAAKPAEKAINAAKKAVKSAKKAVKPAPKKLDAATLAVLLERADAPEELSAWLGATLDQESREAVLSDGPLSFTFEEELTGAQLEWLEATDLDIARVTVKGDGADVWVEEVCKALPPQVKALDCTLAEEKPSFNLEWLGDTLETLSVTAAHPESTMALNTDFCPDSPALTLLTVTARKVSFWVDRDSRGWGMDCDPTNRRLCALVVVAESIHWSTSFEPHPNLTVVKRDQAPDAVIDWIACSNYKSFGYSMIPSAQEYAVNFFNQGCYDEEEWGTNVDTFWTHMDSACTRLAKYDRKYMKCDDGVADDDDDDDDVADDGRVLTTVSRVSS